MPPLLLPEHAGLPVPRQQLRDSGHGSYAETGVGHL